MDREGRDPRCRRICPARRHASCATQGGAREKSPEITGRHDDVTASEVTTVQTVSASAISIVEPTSILLDSLLRGHHWDLFSLFSILHLHLHYI